MSGLESAGTPWFLNVAFCCAFSLWANCANAQISPDGTLPNNSSVTLNGNNFNITGGTQAGSNLFHSFGEFSVPTSSKVFFDNTANIQNIFSRVTGGKVSNIDGLIQANGNANLFLLNPNGIVFGQNARLNIGGSFIASTASGLKFADGTQFLAAGNQTPLLTISVPIGLQFNTPNPGAITVNGSILAVPTQKTFALVGGNVNISGGIISAISSPFVLVEGIPVATTPGGRIELGSVMQGEVNITPSRLGFNLDYVNVPNFGNIQVRGRADVNVSGTGGGEIQINARNVLVSEQARVGSITQGSLKGGNVNINATKSVELIGTGGDVTQTLQLLVTPQINTSNARLTSLYTGVSIGGNGNGGDLTINTDRFIARNNALVITSTQGLGNSGNITINASGAVELTSSILTNGVGVRATGGNGGNLTINTSKLLLQDNAQASTTTLSTGKSGNIILNASESVQFTGGRIIFLRGTGDARIGTGIVTSSVGAGQAGDLEVTTPRLLLQNTGQITASTFRAGQGGNVKINAGSVEITEGNISAVSRGTFGARGGNISISADKFIVRDSGSVNAESQVSGDAGNIDITAREILLDSQGKLIAATVGGRGNITLNSNAIIMQRNSRITTNATGNNTIGGNIAINSDVIGAFENSDISANSIDGRGGNINISTAGLFGAQFRQQQTDQSDITATGKTSELQGNVQINQGIDPTRGLTQLPFTLTESSNQVTAGCPELQNARFIVTGRGGLPEDPKTTRLGQVVLQDFRATANNSDTSKRENNELETSNEQLPIVEAQSWVLNKQGNVELVANIPHNSRSLWNDEIDCQGLRYRPLATPDNLGG